MSGNDVNNSIYQVDGLRTVRRLNNGNPYNAAQNLSPYRARPIHNMVFHDVTNDLTLLKELEKELKFNIASIKLKYIQDRENDHFYMCVCDRRELEDLSYDLLFVRSKINKIKRENMRVLDDKHKSKFIMTIPQEVAFHAFQGGLIRKISKKFGINTIIHPTRDQQIDAIVKKLQKNSNKFKPVLKNAFENAVIEESKLKARLKTDINRLEDKGVINNAEKKNIRTIQSRIDVLINAFDDLLFSDPAMKNIKKLDAFSRKHILHYIGITQKVKS